MNKIISIALLSSFAWAVDHHDLNKTLFSEVYNRNLWGSLESRSGEGSAIYRTDSIRRVLPELLKRLNIKSIIDCGCGDFNWLRTMDLSNIEYTGFDIVDDIVYDNIIKYQDSKRTFRYADITQDPLPCADMALARDCMMHLPDECVKLLINNLKQSGSTYLLASNFPDTQINKDFDDRELYHSSRVTFRNLQKTPFNFPEPIATFHEGFDGKVMTLWRVDDLPYFFDV